MVLLAGTNQNIIIQKNGKVREKERTWEASKKALLGKKLFCIYSKCLSALQSINHISN
jgi:hypothetical protein